MTTPVRVTNRPGLDAVAYRAGTHGSFKRSMLEGLSEASRPALQGLRTRDDDDFSIALLDAWATVADVLTFYQERVANESYLRTATERRSVLELARTIGYELHPGVAADALLAFTVEEAQGAPGNAEVVPGTRVQSVPGPGERPQTFETVGPLDARAEWNALRPRPSAPALPEFGDTEIHLAGVATNLRPGNALLLVGVERRDDPGSENWDFRQVQTVEPDPDRDVTRVTWSRGLGAGLPFRRVEPARNDPQVLALRQQSSLFGSAAPDWRTLHEDIRTGYPDGAATAREWPHLTIAGASFPDSEAGTDAGTGLMADYFDDIALTQPRLVRADAEINFVTAESWPPGGMGDQTFSVRWRGRVVPRYSEEYTFYAGVRHADNGVRLWIDDKKLVDAWDQEPKEHSEKISLEADKEYDLRLEFYRGFGPATIHLSWSSARQRRQVVPQERLRVPRIVHLAPPAPGVLDGSWLVLATAEHTEPYQAQTPIESARSGFGLSGKTTRVELRGVNLDRFNYRVRETAVHAQSEPLPVAERPIAEGVTGNVVELGERVAPPPPGRRLILRGKRMRVRVAPSQVPLQLVAGREKRSLAAGQELIVLEREALPVGTQVRWRLRDATGFEGTVEAAAARLAPVSSRDDDPVASEALTLERAVDVDNARTQLELAEPIAGLYDRPTAAILANVAAATHGQSTVEVLGGGDAARPYLRFALRERPVTHTRAETPSGGVSTLDVRVDDVRWTEVPTLLGRLPRERVYVTRREDDGTTVVRFGDGQEGARPSTGTENVSAAYRTGLGSEANVGAGQLSLLLTRPLGVKSVVNPLSATGGTDPQSLADTRANAPQTVLTLDRVVSLRDFEDFARAYAGVAKALATWIWSTDRRGVLLSVAGPEGAAVADDVRGALLGALTGAGDPNVPLAVRSHRPVPFRVQATVRHDPDRLAEVVHAAAEAALLNAFGFAVRAFGQPVALSEVVAALQDVRGVAGVDVDRLSRGTAAGLRPLLEAEMPRPGDALTDAQPAELLTIDLRRGDIQVGA